MSKSHASIENNPHTQVPKTLASAPQDAGAEALTAEIDAEIARQEALAALERALTPSLRRHLLAYARRREQWLVANGVRSATGEAASYVADAISDTAIGAVVCPRDIPMAQHLRGVIRGRTARRWEREQAAPHASVDDPENGAATRRDLIDAAGTCVDPTTRYVALEQTARVVEYVEQEAAEDPRVLALLRAYQAGAWEPAEVIEATGLTAAEVAAARKRLDRMLTRMPQDGHEARLTESGTW